MKMRIAFSPCPNDLFIFFKFLSEKSPEWDITMLEMEDLNKLAIDGNVDIVKISAGIYPLVKDRYDILRVGSAFGTKDGPIVVAKNLTDPRSIKVLATPGKTTTAHLLYEKLFGKPERILIMEYNEIIPAILDERAEAGILIHEGRLLYRNYGFYMIADLLSLWYNLYPERLPLPLGLIVIKKELGNLKEKVEESILESLNFAKNNYNKALDFIKERHPHLSHKQIEEYINNFVNEYTYSLNDKAIKALSLLLGESITI